MSINFYNNLEKDRKISELKAQNTLELSQQLAKKELEISEMKSKIEKAEIEKKLSETVATQKIKKEREQLFNNLKSKETEKELLEKS